MASNGIRTCDFAFPSQHSNKNKTGTPQVGAISKAQKYSRNNSWKPLEKNNFFFKKTIWLRKTHNAEKPKKRSFRLNKRFLKT